MEEEKRKEQFAFNAEKVFLAAGQPLESVFNYFRTTQLGLTENEVEKRQSLLGRMRLYMKKEKAAHHVCQGIHQPFVGVLTALVAISFVMDVLMAVPGNQDWTSIIIVTTMIVLSAILRFIQEWKASRSSEALQKMVTNTCYVKRTGIPEGKSG